MDFTKPFRLSISAFTKGTSGNDLQPSLSLSKEEVKQIGQIKRDADIAKMTLNRLWNRIGRNQFCLTEGSVVNSKTTLSDYYQAALPHYSQELKGLAALTDTPIYTIAYREKTRVPSPQKAGDAPFDLTLHTFESGLPTPGPLPGAAAVDPNAVAQAGIGGALRPAQMKVGDWNEVVVNNNLLNGFLIDPDSQELSRARRTAFKLEPNPINPLLFSPGTLGSGLKAHIKRRAKTVGKSSLVTKVELGLATPSTSDAESDAADPSGDDQDDTDPDLPADEPLQNLYPLWEICDDSSIKIETISSKLQLASARQGFSSYAVKAALDVSVLSFGGSVSAGFASSTKTTNSDESGSDTEQMHASYNFPRVRLYLDEDSISLSSDCTTALAEIEQSKSYTGVINFFETFGHLFVTRAKLGGRLRATRYFLAGEKSNMASTQEAWKASLAASFATIATSGTASADGQKASSSETKSTTSNSNDSVAWEAQGGDTTLGNNPSVWCSTVDTSGFWRVVEQEAVVPIEDIISKIPGYEGTKALFAGIILDHLMRKTRMEIPWNGASVASLGSGIASAVSVTQPSDILRTPALEVSDVVTTDISPALEVEWFVVHDETSMNSYLEHVFHQTINPLVGTRLYPNLVWRLGASERAFSVVLNLRSGLKKSTGRFSTLGAATQVPDQSNWQGIYGDFYIRSIVHGTALSICWTFVAQTRSSDLDQAKSAVAALFSTPASSFEFGCNFLARLGMDFPCKVYFYDAYYNETVIASPTDVVTTINDLQNGYYSHQVVSVGLDPYMNIGPLQGMAKSTITSPVPAAALEILRKDEAAYACEASKWQFDVSVLSPTDKGWPTWQATFSAETYRTSVFGSSDNAFTPATGLFYNYNDIFTRTKVVVDAQSPLWPAIYGTTDLLQATLEFLRESRKQEIEDLSKPISDSGMPTFGLNVQPQTSLPTPPAVLPPQIQVRVYSLLDAYNDLRKTMGFKGLFIPTDNLDDGMWKDHVINDPYYSHLSLPKPAVVVAYQMIPTSGPPSVMTPGTASSVVKLKVGMELTDFANMRMQSWHTTPGLAIHDVWVVYGPVRYTDIAS